ncbi:MAG: folate-binding protein [Candidatus Nanopelagicales bacterium]
MAVTPVPPPTGSPDEGVAWHYGDPLREQRDLARGAALVDLSHRGVVTVSGPDRLPWLHDLTTAKVDELAPGESRLALILDPHGRVEHELHLVDDGATTWITVEAGAAPTLVTYLRSMQFLRDVVVTDESDRWAVVGSIGADDPLPGERVAWSVPAEFAGTGVTPAGTDRGGGAERYVPRRPATFAAREHVVPRDAGVPEGGRAGTWAWEALRVAAAVPRIGMETDARSLPHELGWIGSGVHLAKGCYRGQETVARTHNMGRPPRRLVLLHLDGSADHLPDPGAEVTSADGVVVGRLTSVAQHFELGPIALAVVKHRVPTDAPLLVAGVAAAQEPVVV